MPKSGEIRAKKYEVKFDPDAVARRFTSTKDIAVLQQSSRQAELAQVRDKVRAVLDSAGINPLFTIPYLSLGNALYRISKEFSGASAQNEAEACATMWVSRGCQKDVVNSIMTTFGFSPLP